MNCNRLLFILLIFMSLASYGQDIKRNLNISRTVDAPTIDGNLNDLAWKNTEIATDFIQEGPVPGAPSSQKTEVRIVYTDDAIFIAAYMYDTAPDSILNQLTERDNEGNSDSFGFWFSPFQDGINAFLFGVTVDGVQQDTKISSNNFDDSWNAVWKSSTRIVEDGWIAEFEIPFSALRFPSKEVQTWDVNFNRNIRRHREQLFWQTVDPNSDGLIIFSGSLSGIKNVDTPTRLFLYPYASTYYNFSKDEETGKVNGASSFNAGMDLKYGLNDAFTLDLTLIPDFGQVQSDNLVLNLSAFEVQFNENRQFFNEGTELFNKGNLFYSRRIGGSPINYYELEDGEEFVQEQEAIQLLNATKISGRNDNGLGIGVLNAITKESSVTVVDSLGNEREIQTSPLTNFNVIVLDQNLKNNSSVSLINTNVMREGKTYDANVTAATFLLNNKENSYALAGNFKYNKKFNYNEDGDDGIAYGLELGKTKGNFRFNLRHSVESKYFDPNDLGILFNPNEIVYAASVNYNINKPFWNGKMNRLWSGIYTGASTLYEGQKFAGHWLGGYFGMVTKNFLSFGLDIDSNPRRGHDYYEPRVDKKHFKRQKNVGIAPWISTDYRKKIALDMRISVYNNINHKGNSRYLRIAPRFRLNDHLQLSYILAYNIQNKGEGFTDIIENDETIHVDDEIIFAKRNVETTTNILSGKYVFNNKMALTLRLRHYWRSVEILNFFELDDFGELIETDFNGFEDDGSSEYHQSYNSFNADIVYTWVFAPGSELSLVWKTALSDFQTEIPVDFGANAKYTFNQTMGNSVSLKLLYFIDYNQFVQKNIKRN